MAALVPAAFAAIGIGVAADYYGTYHYKAFPLEEAKCYQVDARPIGKPGVLVGSAMSESAGALTLFYPRNGQIVRARPIPHSQNWVQLLSGSYVQAQHCGVRVMHEVPCPPELGDRNVMQGPPLGPMPDA